MDCGQKYSFPPIEDGHLEILILGSLPGDESIRRGQYYAHPRNRFWPLMAKLLGKSLPETMQDEPRCCFRHISVCGM